NREDAEDHAEGNEDRDLVEIHDQHFRSDESEDAGEAVFQVREFLLHSGEREIKGPQAENGEDVRGVDDERVLADRENGRDRIDGENQIGEFDDDQSEKEARGVTPSVFVDEEATVMFAGRDGKEFPREANRNGFFEIGFLRRGERHFYSREDEEPAEEVNHPVETFDQRDSAENKNGAHDESAEDSPEKDLMLVLRRDVKR